MHSCVVLSHGECMSLTNPSLIPRTVISLSILAMPHSNKVSIKGRLKHALWGIALHVAIR